MRRTTNVTFSLRVLLCVLGVALIGATLWRTEARADAADEIRGVIGQTWDKPGAKVETDPVVVSGRYAIASWSQGQHGGRALMRREAAGWAVVLCGGDRLKEASGLAEAGVPDQDARAIAAALATAEAALPAGRRVLFSLFGSQDMGEAHDRK